MVQFCGELGGSTFMKRTLFGAAFAAFVLVTAGPALAQTADAADPHKVALAQQVIDATGMKTQMTGMMHNMVGRMIASAGQNAPASAQPRIKAVEQAEEDMMDKMTPKIIQLAVEAYAKTYSEQELTDILAFYQSPSGRAMSAKAPQMMQSMMGGVIALMPQMRRQMGEEVCAKVTCSAAEKRAYFGDAPPAN
jgi:hypothetical protein